MEHPKGGINAFDRSAAAVNQVLVECYQGDRITPHINYAGHFSKTRTVHAPPWDLLLSIGWLLLHVLYRLERSCRHVDCLLSDLIELLTTYYTQLNLLPTFVDRQAFSVSS